MVVKILQKENKVLRENAKEVEIEKIKTGKIKSVLEKMTEALCKNESAVAIAAPQIGESLRIFIIQLKTGLDSNQPLFVFINPVIKKISKKKRIVSEGCLSTEGIYGAIKRAEKLTVEAYNEKGEKFSRNASGLLAQIIQHEIDHLNGILFIDKAIGLKK
jgi:peptide deformylase